MRGEWGRIAARVTTLNKVRKSACRRLIEHCVYQKGILSITYSNSIVFSLKMKKHSLFSSRHNIHQKLPWDKGSHGIWGQWDMGYCLGYGVRMGYGEK